MNLTALIASSVLSALSGGYLAWQLQAHQITKLTLEHTNERIAIQWANRAATERHQSQLAEAQVHAASRGIALRRAAAGAAAAGNGLRVTSADAVRTAASDPATCDAIVSAYAAVLAEATDFAGEVASEADLCFSDLQTMNESWAK